MDGDDAGAPQRSFSRAFPTTWPAIFKTTEMVLCILCFFCNELSWFAFVAYPARTFLSVVACLSFIVTTLTYLVLGFGIDDNYKHTTWWRVAVVAQPAVCALFLVMASAAQLDIGGRADAGLRAAAVFGFLAFTAYLAEAVYVWCRQREAGELPALTMPAAISNNLGNRPRAGGSAAARAENQDLPSGWEVPHDDDDGWSDGSGRDARGTYNLNS